MYQIYLMFIKQDVLILTCQVMAIVMTLQIIWSVTMMGEIAVAMTSIPNFAQIVNALEQPLT